MRYTPEWLKPKTIRQHASNDQMRVDNTSIILCTSFVELYVSFSKDEPSRKPLANRFHTSNHIYEFATSTHESEQKSLSVNRGRNHLLG